MCSLTKSTVPETSLLLSSSSIEDSSSAPSHPACSAPSHPACTIVGTRVGEVPLLPTLEASLSASALSAHPACHPAVGTRACEVPFLPTLEAGLCTSTLSTHDCTSNTPANLTSSRPHRQPHAHIHPPTTATASPRALSTNTVAQKGIQVRSHDDNVFHIFVAAVDALAAVGNLAKSLTTGLVGIHLSSSLVPSIAVINIDATSVCMDSDSWRTSREENARIQVSFVSLLNERPDLSVATSDASFELQWDVCHHRACFEDEFDNSACHK